ncbi:insulin-induced protein-domain-containing protein [Podospora australis]|uniref:Insulin-induced protein-domain-containing protein n=1 Tax=Podospora australis TaxID=1536484 RepID=A0AAN6WRG7_9PEZI|nr:insulin-induced protein-domain-containing protein [Podospora australis]
MDDYPERERGARPEILRPIPRRPFRLNFSSPTPPEDEFPAQPPSTTTPTPRISASDLMFLDIHNNPSSRNSSNNIFNNNANDGSSNNNNDGNISRATSFMNLTGSTLLGIYSPTLTPGLPRENSLDTPTWGIGPPGSGLETGGAQTPALLSRSGVDEDTLQVMKERSKAAGVRPLGIPTKRRTSYFSTVSPTADDEEEDEPSDPPTRFQIALSLMLRGTLLFALGVGYGVLVTRLPSRHHQQPPTSLNWRYLTFWGAAGVALGCLLPWFDRFFSKPSRTATASSIHQGKRGTASPAARERQGLGQEADWPLVIRSIGAFVGIVFAIRKLPWTSTMQVSLTLALANPFLWYLIDRSKPGFLLSAAVGLTGSAVLVGLNHSDLMPAPVVVRMNGIGRGSWAEGSGNTTGATGQIYGDGDHGADETMMMVNVVWMLSVLFCSCVCFGNIGRRLALSGEGAARGRWGGLR